MEKLSQNILRLSISKSLLTIPFGALFISYEYLSYKKGITTYAENMSTKYENLLEKLKETNPEGEYYLDEKCCIQFFY